MPIVISSEHDIARLSLQTGPVNAMGPEFLADLDAALDAAQDARALVLTGAGSAFSAGLDLPRLLTLDETTITGFIAAFSRVMEKVFLWPKPTVAALNGHAVAGGFVLASACDYRLLARGPAKLGMTGVTLGIAYPSLVIAMLQYSVPKAAWHNVLLDGRLYDVEAAQSAQLVESVVDPDVLLERATERALGLCAADPGAYARTKRMLKWETVARAQSLQQESHAAFVSALFSPEGRARLHATVEKMKGTKNPR